MHSTSLFAATIALLASSPVLAASFTTYPPANSTHTSITHSTSSSIHTSSTSEPAYCKFINTTGLLPVPTAAPTLEAGLHKLVTEATALSDACSSAAALEWASTEGYAAYQSSAASWSSAHRGMLSAVKACTSIMDGFAPAVQTDLALAESYGRCAALATATSTARTSTMTSTVEKSTPTSTVKTSTLTSTARNSTVTSTVKKSTLTTTAKPSTLTSTTKDFVLTSATKTSMTTSMAKNSTTMASTTKSRGFSNTTLTTTLATVKPSSTGGRATTSTTVKASAGARGVALNAAALAGLLVAGIFATL